MSPRENRPSPGKNSKRPPPKTRTALQVRPDGSTMPKKPFPTTRLILSVTSGNQLTPVRARLSAPEIVGQRGPEKAIQNIRQTAESFSIRTDHTETGTTGKGRKSVKFADQDNNLSSERLLSDAKCTTKLTDLVTQASPNRNTASLHDLVLKDLSSPPKFMQRQRRNCHVPPLCADMPWEIVRRPMFSDYRAPVYEMEPGTRLARVLPSNAFIAAALLIGKRSPLIPDVYLRPRAAMGRRECHAPTTHDVNRYAITSPPQPWLRRIVYAWPQDPAIVAVGPAVDQPLPPQTPQTYHMNGSATIENLLTSFRGLRDLDKPERKFLMAALRALSEDDTVGEPEEKQPASLVQLCLQLDDCKSAAFRAAQIKSSQKSKLNPSVPEFRSTKSKDNGERTSTSRQSQHLDPIEVELQENLNAQYELEAAIKAHAIPTSPGMIQAAAVSKPRKRIVVLDDAISHGREVSAFEDWFAKKQLQEFVKKYPLTGIKHIANTPKPPPRRPRPMISMLRSSTCGDVNGTLVTNGHSTKNTNMRQKTQAAEVQLRLEALLLKKKEKKASEQKEADLEAARQKTARVWAKFQKMEAPDMPASNEVLQEHVANMDVWLAKWRASDSDSD